jgi:hypothetical protein
LVFVESITSPPALTSSTRFAYGLGFGLAGCFVCGLPFVAAEVVHPRQMCDSVGRDVQDAYACASS